MARMYKMARPAPKRRKRSGAEVREEGLAAARRLLLDGGPGAVTLANVGEAIGMSHANVLHHFGSAAGLQSALMGSMIQDLTGALDNVVDLLKTDDAAPRTIADHVFDAFDKGGAGPLAAWIVLSGDVGRLEPIREAVGSLVTARGLGSVSKGQGPAASRMLSSDVDTRCAMPLSSMALTNPSTSPASNTPTMRRSGTTSFANVSLRIE